MMPLWVLFVLVGAAGGFTAGLFGVGGGLVIVPTLYFLWHTDPLLGPEVMHHAVATSLACIVVTSLTSSWTHWRAQRLQFERLTPLALAVSLGAASAVDAYAMAEVGFWAVCAGHLFEFIAPQIPHDCSGNAPP